MTPLILVCAFGHLCSPSSAALVIKASPAEARELREGERVILTFASAMGRHLRVE